MQHAAERLDRLDGARKQIAPLNELIDLTASTLLHFIEGDFQDLSICPLFDKS